MMDTVNKELISQLQKLEAVQQEQVLAYVNELLITEEMNKRAELSEQDIANGNTISMEQFDQELEAWIASQRTNTQ